MVLKSVEGVSSAVMRIMASLLKKNAPENADLSFVKKSMGDFMAMYDFNSLGGAVLLGVNKPIVKAHGSANDKTLVSTVKQAIQMHKGVK